MCLPQEGWAWALAARAPELVNFSVRGVNEGVAGASLAGMIRFSLKVLAKGNASSHDAKGR